MPHLILPVKTILSIAYPGVNIHLLKKATPTIATLIMENDMNVRLLDGSTMESTHIATLQIPGLIKQAREIHIFPKIKTAPLISLGVSCDD